MTTITTTVTFADLREQYDPELEDLRSAYDDVLDLIEAEYGEDAPERPTPSDPDDPDAQRLAALQATALAYEQSAKSIQSRQAILERLEDEYDGDTFEIRMLSGQELMDIESKLKAKAREEGVDAEEIQHYRKGLVVDSATVSAPEGVPRGLAGQTLFQIASEDPADADDSTPMPSEAPNALTLSLYEAVENLNQGGAPDFRAPGFGDRTIGAGPNTSATPTDSAAVSKPSAPIEESTPGSGSDSSENAESE